MIANTDEITVEHINNFESKIWELENQLKELQNLVNHLPQVERIKAEIEQRASDRYWAS